MPFDRIRFRWIVLCLIFMLAGCAGTHLAKRAENKNHPGKVTAAAVIWVEQPNMKFWVSKTAYSYGGVTPVKPTISSSEELQANARLSTAMNAFRRGVVSQLYTELAPHGVARGRETRIIIQPVTAQVLANNGGVSIQFQVSVLHADAQAPWVIQPIAQNVFESAYASGISKSGIESSAAVDQSKLVDAFAATVVREMLFAGWFR